MTEPRSDSLSLHEALGLTDEEYRSICGLLERQPNQLELAMYAVMWSEHCSYKSSRMHLERLPTQAPCVLVGPGENAGVVDVGDDIAIALRIESHNHPSAIEPYQGAATGVGGILRDIFTMGARPIAIADPLRVGPLDEPHSNWIAAGIVSGISGYGNSVGVPTVAGEFVSCDSYRHNPLVNVAALGIMPSERLVLGQATEVGSAAVLMGAATGRDGIGGVSVLASAGFAEADDASTKRPSVQVGDPFEEKRLIEACLELLDEGLIGGIQDLGGAGLTCAASETAARGGTGMEIDVSAVPLRQRGMAPFEIMTSESQERMLAIVTPAKVARVLEICSRWEVSATVVGRVTDDCMLRVCDGVDGEVLAEIPAGTLHDDAPRYDRPLHPPANLAARRSVDPAVEASANSHVAESQVHSVNECATDLLAMLADPRWVYRQYDHQLFLNTVVGPGYDATLLRLRDPRDGTPTGRGLALSVDGNHRWCDVDPRKGTAMVVLEAALNLACVGADPLAIVNCLNFGNPTHPEVMWQLSEAIDGMADACDALGIPVVGGNVSLYNETDGVNICPTPVVCMIGVHPELSRRPIADELAPGTRLMLLAPSSLAPSSLALAGTVADPTDFTADDQVWTEAGSSNVASPRFAALGGSRWAWDRRKCRDGTLPELDLAGAVATAVFTAAAVRNSLVRFAHDVSDGGLGVALAEMCCHGRSGVQARIPALGASAPAQRALFAEPPGRVLAAVEPANLERLVAAASEASIACYRLGTFGGSRVQIGRVDQAGLDIDLALDDVLQRWQGALPHLFAQPIGGGNA